MNETSFSVISDNLDPVIVRETTLFILIGRFVWSDGVFDDWSIEIHIPKLYFQIPKQVKFFYNTMLP